MANDNLEDLKNGKRSAPSTDMTEFDDMIQENGECSYEDLLIITNCETFTFTGF